MSQHWPGWPSYRGEWSGFQISLAVLASLLAVDIVLGDDAVITTSFALAPFVAAIAGGRRATLATGALATALAVISGAWNADFGHDEYFVRAAIVAAASGFALLAARAVAGAASSIRRFALLNDLAAAADGSAPLPETMRLISDVIVPELADYCMVDIVAEGRIDRVAVRAHGPDREQIEATLRRRHPSLPEQIVEADDGSLIEPRFWERATEAHLRSIAHDEDDLEFLLGLDVRSVVTVALVARGRRVGALTLVVTGSRHYRRDDVRFAEVLADRVALALDNAGLFSDLQSVERRMDTVMEVLDEAVVIFDRSGRLVFANGAAARLLRFDSPQELLDAPEGAVRERFDLYDEMGAPLPLDDFSPFPALRGEEGGSQIVRAISRSDGRELWMRAKSRVVPGLDEEPLYAVTALEDLTEIKKEEFEQTLLARMGELLASADYQEVVERLTELVIPQLADWCSVYTPRPDGSIVEVATAHSDAAKIGKAREVLAHYPLRVDDEVGPAEVLRTGEPIVVEDLAPLLRDMAPDEARLEALRETGVGSAMLLPIRTGGEVIGTLVLVNQADRRPFDDFDRGLADKVAERAAVALGTARHATERREIADTLQQGLLPAPLPHIPGWSVAALYRPGGGENEVGGDFYDAFGFEGGWILVLGDVTGRGAWAASITALARYTLRTASTLSGDPLVALATLNRALLSREDPALCSVAALALSRGSDREVRIAVAGHPPPLLVDAAGVREAAAPGPVLGAFPDESWQLQSTRLEPGQQLVVFTDGVTEAAGPEDRFGEHRLRARLLGATSPATAIRRVEQALDAFCQGDPADDAAMLAIGPADRTVVDAELERLLRSRET
jgi:GAF domain-containing protein